MVIEGKADRPLWLSISDDRVEALDARRFWGQGIRRTTAEISQRLGAEVAAAAIGQAGRISRRCWW